MSWKMSICFLKYDSKNSWLSKKRLNIYIYGIRDQNLAPLSIQQGLNRRCPDPYGVTPSQRGPHLSRCIWTYSDDATRRVLICVRTRIWFYQPCVNQGLEFLELVVIMSGFGCLYVCFVKDLPKYFASF